MQIRFVLQSMLSRPGNILGALVAHALAVTIIFATMVVLLSTFEGPGVAPRLEATDLVVRVDPAKHMGVASDSVPRGIRIRLPAGLPDEIAAIPGVESVVPDVTFFAQAVNAEGMPVTVPDTVASRGQSWESAALTPFTVLDGDPPITEDEVVIDRALADAAGVGAGGEVMLATRDAPALFRVSGIAALEDAAGMDGQASIFFSPATAEHLANAGGETDLIGVMLQPGANPDSVQREIESVVDDDAIDVLSGPSRGKADVTAGGDDLRDLGTVLGVMSGFVGFVAIFVLAGTFSFSIQQRHREIGLQRAVGFTPGQVRRMIVLESAVIAAIASVIGVLAGWLLARVFVWGAIRQGRAPEGFSVSFQPLAMWIVLAASFGIALLAALSASRRASKIRPIEALRESAAPKRWIGFRRLLFGLVFIIGGGAAVVASTSLPAVLAVLMSLLTTTTLTIGAALLGPLLVIPCVALFSLLMRSRTNATAELATTNSRAFPIRVASVTSPVLLALGFATLMFCFIETNRVAAIQISDERMTADLYVVPASDGLPLSVEPLIAGIDGVESSDYQLPSMAMFQGDDGLFEVASMGVDPTAVTSTMALDVESGDLEQFSPGSVFLSDFATLDLPFGVGDTATFLLEDMTQLELHVAGEFTNSLGTADMLIAHEDILPHLREPLISLVLVNVADGIDPDSVAADIERLGESGYPLQVLTHEQYIAGVDQSAQSESWATFLIIGGAALFGGLSVINTLVMSTTERSREFALLRLIGATPRQVMEMLAKEAAVVSLIGILLGWGIGILSTVSVSLGFVGDTSALTVPILPVLAVGLLAGAIIFASILIPGSMMLKREPIQEIGMRE